MSLATILEQEISGEIAQVKAQAQAQADAILSRAREQAQTLLDSRSRALESDYQAGVVRAKSAADLESAALRLSTADRGQAAVFQQAEQQLRAVTQYPEYTDILRALIEQARAAVPNAEAVEVHPNDQDRAREALNQLGMHVEVRPNPRIETGVRLVANGGKASVQNTLLGRLAGSRDALAGQVAAVLNGQ